MLCRHLEGYIGVVYLLKCVTSAKAFIANLEMS